MSHSTQAQRRWPAVAAVTLVAAVLALSPALATARQGGQPTTQPTPRPASQQAQDPADAVLERLLGEATSRRTTAPAASELRPDRHAGGIDRTSGGGDQAIAPNTRPQRLVREGTYVVDRVGWVRASRDGRDFEFVFEADGRAPASAADPPMLLIPNLNLMAVESAVRDEPERRVRVSGRVTEYRGRNHLLLEKVVLLG